MNTSTNEAIASELEVRRVVEAARDALSDEMIGRLAETMAEGLSLVDRLSRGGALRLVEMLERMQASGALERIALTLPRLVERLEAVEHVLGSLESALADAARMPAPQGGIGGLWQIARDAETQRGMQLLLSFGKHLRDTGK